MSFLVQVVKLRTCNVADDRANQMGKQVSQKRTDVVCFGNPAKYGNEIGNITQVRKRPLNKQVRKVLTLQVRQ